MRAREPKAPNISFGVAALQALHWSCVTWALLALVLVLSPVLSLLGWAQGGTVGSSAMWDNSDILVQTSASTSTNTKARPLV